MGSMVSDSLFIPALGLAVIAFAMPRLIARLLPEGVKPLLLNAFLSTLALTFVSAAFFVGLYLWQGMTFGEIMSPGLSRNVVFFGRLGLISAIIWAPIMVLSVAGLPRRWVSEKW